MTAELVIRRDKSDRIDLLVPYGILVNGKHAGRIWWGREVRINVAPGRWRVQLRASGLESRVMTAHVASGVTAFFDCRPRGRQERRPGDKKTGKFPIVLKPGELVVDPAALQSIAPLFDLICRPLQPDDRSAAWERFAAAYRTNGANLGNSLRSALADFEVKMSDDAWLLLQVDWKACDEVEWQAQAIARTLKIDSVLFQWDWQPIEAAHLASEEVDPPAAVGIREFDNYLTRRGHRYLEIDEDSDEFLGIALPKGDVPVALDLAAATGHALRLVGDKQPNS